jgi:hypothetical protein
VGTEVRLFRFLPDSSGGTQILQVDTETPELLDAAASYRFDLTIPQDTVVLVSAAAMPVSSAAAGSVRTGGGSEPGVMAIQAVIDLVDQGTEVSGDVTDSTLLVATAVQIALADDLAPFDEIRSLLSDMESAALGIAEGIQDFGSVSQVNAGAEDVLRAVGLLPPEDTPTVAAATSTPLPTDTAAPQATDTPPPPPTDTPPPIETPTPELTATATAEPTATHTLRPDGDSCTEGLECQSGSCNLCDDVGFCGPSPRAAGQACAQFYECASCACDDLGQGSICLCNTACDCDVEETCLNGQCIRVTSPLYCCDMGSANTCPAGAGGASCEAGDGSRSTCP